MCVALFDAETIVGKASEAAVAAAEVLLGEVESRIPAFEESGGENISADNPLLPPAVEVSPERDWKAKLTPSPGLLEG